jgi:hypothetical protein
VKRGRIEAATHARPAAEEARPVKAAVPPGPSRWAAATSRERFLPLARLLLAGSARGCPLAAFGVALRLGREG